MSGRLVPLAHVGSGRQNCLQDLNHRVIDHLFRIRARPRKHCNRAVTFRRKKKDPTTLSSSTENHAKDFFDKSNNIIKNILLSMFWIPET